MPYGIVPPLHTLSLRLLPSSSWTIIFSSLSFLLSEILTPVKKNQIYNKLLNSAKDIRTLREDAATADEAGGEDIGGGGGII